MKKEQIKGSLSLFLAAIIWGAAFVAQSVGMDYVGPFTFNCVRTLIGGIVLIPCIAFLNRGKVRKKTNFTEKKTHCKFLYNVPHWRSVLHLFQIFYTELKVVHKDPAQTSDHPQLLFESCD